MVFTATIAIQCETWRLRHITRSRVSAGRPVVITALLLISGLALGQAATAPAAADGELKAKVEKLVPQLDSNEAAKREAAEKELIALGPEVLPLLPTTGPRTPAEVRIRLGRIRTALVKAEVEAETGSAHV